MSSVTSFILTLRENGLRTQLEAFIRHLHASEKYNDEEGYHFWPGEVSGCRTEDGDLDCGTCTNGAFLVVRKFGGKVFGYPEGANPSALAGKPSNYWDKAGDANWGHDFAVVDHFLIDYWLCHFTEDYHKGVFDMNDPEEAKEVARLYGDPKKWVHLPDRKPR